LAVGLLAEQQQGVRGDGGVVGDQALADHLREPRPGHPGLAHVLLFVLPLRRPGFQPGGQEEVAALAADAVRAVQVPELDQVASAEPGFLRELQPGELLRAARRPGREPALRKRPGAPPDRVAELLDHVEAVVLGRDDQREVGLLDERVRAARTVAPLDLVTAQAHPVVLIDDAGGEHADVRALLFARLRGAFEAPPSLVARSSLLSPVGAGAPLAH
jgi:hypothetical protein